MILEHALLPVAPIRHGEFEAAFAEAGPLIAGMPGFRSLTLSRCLEDDGTYLLLVEWDALEDHTVGFRGSTRVPGVAATAAHDFYDPFPTVWHFEAVDSAGSVTRSSAVDTITALLRSLEPPRSSIPAARWTPTSNGSACGWPSWVRPRISSWPDGRTPSTAPTDSTSPCSAWTSGPSSPT